MILNSLTYFFFYPRSQDARHKSMITYANIEWTKASQTKINKLQITKSKFVKLFSKAH